MCTDLCEDVESKYKISEIVDELAEKKPQKTKKNVDSATPAHRHGRRSAVAIDYQCFTYLYQNRPSDWLYDCSTKIMTCAVSRVVRLNRVVSWPDVLGICKVMLVMG